MNKIAAYSSLLQVHPLWSKEAEVFGESPPDVSEAIEPISYRTAKMEAYARQKADEKPTPVLKALLTGGAIGGTLGGLTGALAAGRKGAVIGGVSGAGVGALYGGVLATADKAEIEAMRDLVETGEFERAAVDAGLEQVRARRAQEQAERDLAEMRRRQEHEDQMRRLSRIESQVTYGNQHGSPYRY